MPDGRVAERAAPPQGDDVPAVGRPAPPASLRAVALGALARAACTSEPSAAEPLELRFLRAQLGALGGPRADWRATLAAYRCQPAALDAPLLALADAFGMSDIELLAVTLAAAVEDDLLIGRTIARLQAPVGGSRPTIGLLVTALSDSVANGTRPIDTLLSGPSLACGLLVLLGEGAPHPERPVAVPQHLCAALGGGDGVATGASIGHGDAPLVPLAPSLVREAARQARALDAAPQRVLVLRTGSDAEGRAVAVAVAQAMGRRPVFIDAERIPGLTPWLLLRDLVPVFRFDLGPGERKVVPALPLYRGPSLVLCGPDGSVETPSGAALSWSIPVPPRAEREALWRNALDGSALASDLARDHRHGAGRIAHLGRLVRHHLQKTGRSEVTRDDLSVAAWAGEGTGLEALAQPLTDRIPDEALVAPPALHRELDLLLLRCRSRDELVADLGVSATTRYRPGVRALFVGASGTGKTLGAGWLATRLGLPLYRVDLASVTSKYIGETEKNLAQLLARAEQAEVVLLFDEADSLFGKRTDVREANDRFANQQTNYLLQRIESFDGISLLTSNGRGRFDSAFARRLDMVIEFPAPGPEERRALWVSHLGDTRGLAAQEINRLAARLDFCGGHIRNAVLTAAMLARADGRPIGYRDVLRGVEGECRKMGRQVPVDLQGGV